MAEHAFGTDPLLRNGRRRISGRRSSSGQVADDHVTIVMTRDTTAAQARGFSSNQVMPLGGDLIVPGQSTFYWNGQGSANSAGGQCSVIPGSPEFR